MAPCLPSPHRTSNFPEPSKLFDSAQVERALALPLFWTGGYGRNAAGRLSDEFLTTKHCNGAPPCSFAGLNSQRGSRRLAISRGTGSRQRNQWNPSALLVRMETIMSFGKGALLWLIGIPLPIILLLALFIHH